MYLCVIGSDHLLTFVGFCFVLFFDAKKIILNLKLDFLHRTDTLFKNYIASFLKFLNTFV